MIPELTAQNSDERAWLYRLPAFQLEPPRQREGSAAVFLNKEGSLGFGESSVSPSCIQHRSPPPIDPRGSRPPGYLWSWSARAFVSPSADLPTFPNFPALCYLREKITFPGRETTARRPHSASKPRAPATVAPPCGLRASPSCPGALAPRGAAALPDQGRSVAALEQGCK